MFSECLCWLNLSGSFFFCSALFCFLISIVFVAKNNGVVQPTFPPDDEIEKQTVKDKSVYLFIKLKACKKLYCL